MIIPSRHFSPFKLFLHPETGTALMLNPKVATTFTRRFLASGFVEQLDCADPSGGRYAPLSMPRRFPTARLRDYAGFFLRPKRYDLYGFVRNPYGRLLSAWRNKFLDAHFKTPDHGDTGYPRSVRAHKLATIRRFARTRGLPGGAPNTLIHFETFLAYVATQRAGRRDHHWDTQESVLMADRLTYARIFRVEDMGNEGFLIIGRRLGFAEDWMARMLAAPAANNSKVAADGYNARTAALAQHIVGADPERFGYDRGSWREF